MSALSTFTPQTANRLRELAAKLVRAEHDHYALAPIEHAEYGSNLLSADAMIEAYDRTDRSHWRAAFKRWDQYRNDDVI